MTAVERIPDISATSAWKALGKHHDQIVGTHLREFFAADPDRGREFTVTIGDLYIDYSKHRIDRETLHLLTDLARAAELERRGDEMFSGVHINISEASDPGMMLGVRLAGSTRPPLPGVCGLRYAAASLGKVHVGGCFRRHHRLRRSPI